MFAALTSKVQCNPWFKKVIIIVVLSKKSFTRAFFFFILTFRSFNVYWSYFNNSNMDDIWLCYGSGCRNVNSTQTNFIWNFNKTLLLMQGITGDLINQFGIINVL